MASRPVYLPTMGTAYVKTALVEFEWSPGLSLSQKRRSIAALHKAASETLHLPNVLEISSKSDNPLGVHLSAFNLRLESAAKVFSVETGFQSSKVFECGGPFVDLLEERSINAKRDPRLRTSGRLVAFNFMGDLWPLQPSTAFYDWLYLTALREHPNYAQQLLGYAAFTDIEFNPERSVNTQAHSAALFVSLSRRGLLDQALSSKHCFLQLMSDAPRLSSGRGTEQSAFGF